MESADYLIVGGGVAGTSAAAEIRKHDKSGRIIILTDEPYRLYTRMALPSLARKQTTDEQIVLRDEKYYADRNLELWNNVLASSLDVEASVVTLADGQRITYGKLLLAGGSRVRDWKVPGATVPGVVPLRTLNDAQYIRSLLPKVKHALIVGGGFIALDQIQTLAHAGVATTVVTRGPYFWSGVLDEESGILIQKLFDQAGNVHLRHKTRVEMLEGDAKVEAALLSDGKRLPVDLVLLSIGVGSNVGWLEGGGLDVSSGVSVDKYLQTEIDNIWAAGDIALFDDTILGLRHRLGNWHNASAQGETAGFNMVSTEPKPFEAVTSYFVSVFGTDISFIGDVRMQAGVTAVPRGSARSGAYGRILVRDERVVGATLINRFAERGPIEQLIRSRRQLRQRDVLDLTDESVPLRDVAQR
jgi:nitrite reductase (NADH) large subunit